MVAETPQVVAIVQARGGSKGIPRKNIKPLRGIPLIAYSIAAGLQAQTVDRVIVSTDDDEIAAVAQQWGAEVPFRRPAEHATDTATDLPVFEHALGWLAKHEGYLPELVVQLRPTSPIRPVDCIDRAVALLRQNPQADSVRGVVPSGQNPYKMWRIPDPGGPMQPLLDSEFDEPYNMPRQKLPPTYWQTGHIDVLRQETIMQQHSMSGDTILPLLIDPAYMIDIDSPLDWDKAEWMLERLEIEYVRPQHPGVDRIQRALQRVRLLVLDFDGVLTDDRVWVSEEGIEMVAAHRGDGLGIEMLREIGIEPTVLSREANPVVAARCRKLKITLQQGIRDKVPALQAILAERGLTPDQVIYVGNDVNDLGPMSVAGLSVAVADAHPTVRQQADLILTRRGGHGAVRELCDRIIAAQKVS